MRRFTEFIKNWGGFIALCIVALAFFTCFVVGEFKCESDFLRILIGAVTMPFCTIAAGCAIIEFLSPKNLYREQ